MVIRSGSISLFLFFLAAPCFADDSASRVGDAPRDDSGAAVARPPDRIGFYGMGGLGIFHRDGDGSGGPSMGGELAYVFHGSHGLRLGYSYGVGIFGPEVNAFDLAYSYQWSTRPRLDGVGVSGGLLFGPSVAIVNYDGNQPDIHATFGGRAGGFVDLNLWMFALGVDASYRFGFSNPYGPESYAVLGAHLGVTFEIGGRGSQPPITTALRE